MYNGDRQGTRMHSEYAEKQKPKSVHIGAKNKIREAGRKFNIGEVKVR